MLPGTLCSETAQCKYWTWISDPSIMSWTSSKKCYLKEKSSGLSSKQGVISGAKNCPLKCPAMNQDLYGNDISGEKKVVSSWQECGKLFFQK